MSNRGGLVALHFPPTARSLHCSPSWPSAWLLACWYVLELCGLRKSGSSLPSGNLPQLVRPENVGDADFEWVKAFGTSVRIKSPFGVSTALVPGVWNNLSSIDVSSVMCCSRRILRFAGDIGTPYYSANPEIWKALQYILGTSGYKFRKSMDFRFMIRMLTGKGLIWADG
jgi:hypothetical protein